MIEVKSFRCKPHSISRGWSTGHLMGKMVGKNTLKKYRMWQEFGFDCRPNVVTLNAKWKFGSNFFHRLIKMDIAYYINRETDQSFDTHTLTKRIWNMTGILTSLSDIMMISWGVASILSSKISTSFNVDGKQTSKSKQKEKKSLVRKVFHLFNQKGYSIHKAKAFQNGFKSEEYLLAK